MKIFLTLLFISLSSSTIALATVELDILNGKISPQPSLSTSKFCSNCITPGKQSAVGCPSNIDYIVNQTLTKTIYNMMIGKKLLDVCQSSAKAISSSPELLDKNLAAMLSQDFTVPQNLILACFEKNGIDFRKTNIKAEGASKIITAYLHSVNKGILESQAENVKQIGAMDQLLGKAPLTNFRCDKNLDKVCEEIRSCQDNNSFDEIVDFSMKGLKEISELREQAQELRLNRRISEEDRAKATTDIQQKLQFVSNMMPWFNGDELKNKMFGLAYKIKHNEDKDAREEFKVLFKKQISKTRDVLKNKFYEASVSLDCVQGKGNCTEKTNETINSYLAKDYSKNEIDISKYDSKNPLSRKAFLEAQETNLMIKSGSCVKDLLEGKKEVDESMALIASTGVSLVAGGMGGVLKLGQMAVKFYQAGNIIKGVSSIAVLGAEAKSLSNTISTISTDCHKAFNEIEYSQSSKVSGCSKDGASTFKVTKLSSCIANISMTTLPYLLSLRPKLGKSVEADELTSIKAVADQKKYFVEKITNKLITPAEKDNIANALSKLKLSEAERADVIAKMNTIVKSEKDKNKLKNYINFVLSLKPEDQILAISKLHEVVLDAGKFNPGGYAEKFYIKENKFYLFEKFKTESIKKKLINQGRTEVQATNEAEEIARLSRSKLQNKYYACQSKTLTPEIALAAKRYTGFSVAMGVGGTTYGYYNSNKDKFKDNKSEFFGLLGYDIAMSYLLSKLSAEIMKSPEGTFLKRYTMSNVGQAEIGLLGAGVFSKLYGVSEEESKKRVEEILHNPEALKELDKLDKYIDKSNLVDKFKNSIIDSYRKVLMSKDQSALTAVSEVSKIESFSNLSLADLEKPEIKEKLYKAVLLEMNSGSLGALISTGDLGGDRWVNDRLWNAAIGVPKGIAIGMGVFQVLCMGADNPVLSLGVASGIQFANQFISGDFYYKFRKETIGQ